MYKIILVPLDGSGRAESILPHAEQLAQNTGAKLLLLRVVGPQAVGLAQGVDVPVEEPVSRSEQAHEYLRGKQGELKEKGLEAGHRVVEGPVVEAIIKTAQREDVDLIAMASHGRSGIQRVFYGSVAAGVLQRVDRPILLVRSRGL